MTSSLSLSCAPHNSSTRPRRSLRRSTDKADDPSPSKTVANNLQQHVTIKLQSSKRWGDSDFVRNKIIPLSRDEPGPRYITKLRDKLSQKRLVTGAEGVGTPPFFLFFLFSVFCPFLWGRRGNASCTVALLGAVCGLRCGLPLDSLDNSAARPTH